jgi:transcriptional regulator with XRE-family HTH domain
MIYGKRIRELRGFDMSKAEFARRIGISQGHFSHIERGEKEIGAEIPVRIQQESRRDLTPGRIPHIKPSNTETMFTSWGTFTPTVSNPHSRLSNAALWERGIESASNISRPTLMKCASVSTTAKPYLFRDTILELVASNNLEYKELTKEVI